MTETQTSRTSDIGGISLACSIAGIIFPLLSSCLSRFGLGFQCGKYPMSGLYLFALAEIVAFILGIRYRDSSYGKLGVVISVLSLSAVFVVVIIREYLNRGSNIMGF